MKKEILLSLVMSVGGLSIATAETPIMNANYYGFELANVVTESVNTIKKDAGWWNPTITSVDDFSNCISTATRAKDDVVPATGNGCLRISYTGDANAKYTLQASANDAGKGIAPFTIPNGQYCLAIKVYIPSSTANANDFLITINNGINHEFNSFSFPVSTVTERNSWVQLKVPYFSANSVRHDFIVADNFGLTEEQLADSSISSKNVGYAAGTSKINVVYNGTATLFYIDDIEILPYDPSSAEVAEVSKANVSVQGATLTVTGAEGEQMNVYDIAGRTVLSTKAESDDATYTLTPGLYIVKAGTTTQKVVIK